MPADQPYISVVIPTYGEKGEALTKQCVESMIDTHTYIEPELVVVEDGGGCQHEFVKGLGATILQVERGGFAKACNAGIRRTNGQIVFLINNDIEFVEPSLQFAADALGSTSSGLVGIRLLYPDGRIQFGGTYFKPTPDGELPGYFDHAYRFENGMHVGVTTMRKRCLLTGAFLGIARWTFSFAGYLDERYGFSVEDVDYCMSAMQAGIQTLFFGYTAAIHHEGATRGRTLEEKLALAPDVAEKEQESLRFFFRKWNNVDMTMFGLNMFGLQQ